MNTATQTLTQGVIKCAKEHNLTVPIRQEHDLNKSLTQESSVPIKVLRDLISAIVVDNKCPQFPLLFGKWLVGKDVTLVGFICENCESLNESFAVAMRYLSLNKTTNPIFGNARFLMKEVAENIQVQICYTEPDYEMYGSELVIARIVSSIRRTVRDDFPFVKVTFKHSQQAPAEEYQNIFNCPIEFCCPQNTIVFPKQSLFEKVHATQPYVKRILKEHVDSIFEESRIEPKLLREVKELIIRDMPQGNMSLKRISRALMMSESSLQRKLKAIDTSFIQLVEEVRKSLAEKYLVKGESVTTITFLLGFSDVSAFSRAFKRWFGVSPSCFRS